MRSSLAVASLATLASLAAAQSTSGVPLGYGRFPCTVVNADGTFSAGASSSLAPRPHLARAKLTRSLLGSASLCSLRRLAVRRRQARRARTRHGQRCRHAGRRHQPDRRAVRPSGRDGRLLLRLGRCNVHDRRQLRQRPLRRGDLVRLSLSSSSFSSRSAELTPLSCNSQGGFAQSCSQKDSNCLGFLYCVRPSLSLSRRLDERAKLTSSPSSLARSSRPTTRRRRPTRAAASARSATMRARRRSTCKRPRRRRSSTASASPGPSSLSLLSAAPRALTDPSIDRTQLLQLCHGRVRHEEAARRVVRLGPDLRLRVGPLVRRLVAQVRALARQRRRALGAGCVTARAEPLAQGRRRAGTPRRRCTGAPGLGRRGGQGGALLVPGGPAGV